MISNLKVFLERWRSSKNRKHDLDVLIERARPDEDIYHRLLWLVDLIQWIRFKTVIKDPDEIQNEKVPAARVKFFLLQLDRKPEWKTRIAKTLRSIVRDTRAVDLFCEIGLTSENSFWGEFKTRLLLKMMPEPPLHERMSHLFNALFPEPEDVEWMGTLSGPLFARLLEIFHFDEAEVEVGWNRFIIDIQDAMVILAADLESIGLSSHLRQRMNFDKIQDLPFVKLQEHIQLLIDGYGESDTEKTKSTMLEFQKHLGECISFFDQVFSHLDQFGINQNVVFLLESGRAKVRRLDDLASFLMFESVDPHSILFFLIQLVHENQMRQSLSELFEQNTRLLARKIVDRSAEDGEHYITRDKTEYKKIFKKAAGGGWLTAFTVYIKFAITSLPLPLFFEGLFSSLNYAVSFVAIQLLGFTLATKQPAMTGPALAAKMEHMEDEDSLNNLIDEIVNVIRTQSVCILGNVGLVVPTVILIEFVSHIISGQHLISAEKAQKIILSTHILGPTVIYATFTGGLLWISSLIAGWFDNWFVLNNMRATITYNRTLNFIFGQVRCDKYAEFFERNISGFAGNISLGLLLGLAPQFLNFFGIFLDVRHITLSSGSLAAAAAVFGPTVLGRLDFWMAVLGIVFIGILNVGVSFTLAFLVALRSRNVRAPQRRLIYTALWKRFRRNPAQFIRPS